MTTTIKITELAILTLTLPILIIAFIINDCGILRKLFPKTNKQKMKTKQKIKIGFKAYVSQKEIPDNCELITDKTGNKQYVCEIEIKDNANEECNEIKCKLKEEQKNENIRNHLPR